MPVGTLLNPTQTLPYPQCTGINLVLFKIWKT